MDDVVVGIEGNATGLIDTFDKAAAAAGNTADQFDDAAKRTGKSMDDAEKSSGEAFKKIAGGAAIAAGAVVAALGAGIAAGIEQYDLAGSIQAQLQTTPEYAAEIGDAASAAYAAGWGESLEEVGQSAATIGKILNEVGDAGDIEDLTIKAQALAQTFDTDVSGAANAAGQLIRTGLAADSTEAFDIITRGFQGSANAADDWLDTINEYSGQFSQLGVDGQVALGLIEQGMAAGARNGDLVADAFKEFGIRAREGGDEARSAFDAMGLSSDDLVAKIAAGGAGAAEGLQQALDGLRQMEDPVERNAAAVALFGTQAEDLGDALFALDPSTAVEGLGQVGGAAEQMVGQTKGAGQDLQSLIRTVQMELGEAFAPLIPQILSVVESVMPLIATLGEQLIPVIDALMPVVTELAGTLGEVLVDAAGAIVPIIGELAPVVVQLLDAIMPLIPVALDLVTAFAPLAGDILGVLAEVLVAVVERAVEFAPVLMDILDAAMPLIDVVLDLVSAFLPLLDPLLQLVGIIIPPLVAILSELLTPIVALISPLVDLLTPAIEWLSTALGDGVERIVEFGEYLTGGGDVVKLVGDQMAGVFKWLFDNVITPLFAHFGIDIDDVVRIVQTGFGIVMSVVDQVGNAFGRVFGGIGSFIADAFASAVGGVRGAINGIIGLVNGAISALNGLQVTIPDWVPGVGGQTWGVDLPTIPALATGGTALRGGLALVGEQGPEIVSLPQGASVTPAFPSADALERIAGNGSTTVNVDVEVKQTREGSLQELGDRIGRDVAWHLSTAGV